GRGKGGSRRAGTTSTPSQSNSTGWSEPCGGCSLTASDILGRRRGRMRKRHKGRRSAAASRARRPTPRRARALRSSNAEKKNVAQLTRALNEAREQQVATSEVSR